MNLIDKDINYMIISSYSKDLSDYDNHININRLQDKLYIKEFTLIKLQNAHNEVFFFAYKKCNNNELRYDAIELLDEFKQEFVIVKYLKEETVTKIMHDGSERNMVLENYNPNTSDIDFFTNGFTFSFKEQKRYYTPTKQSDFKQGMIVEYKNNEGSWVEKEVLDPIKEYENLYNLLIKYKKIRIPA